MTNSPPESLPDDSHLLPGAELKLGRAGQEFVTDRRIRLLEAIGQCGSITQAATLAGLSYKGAWDSIEQMNNLAAGPLVIRQAGGRHGGGTRLTDRGHDLVRRYRHAAQLHQQFMALLAHNMEQTPAQPDSALAFTGGRLGMQISIRNQLLGTVSVIQHGAVNTEVTLSLGLSPGQEDQLTAMVTSQGLEQLDVGSGDQLVALVRESAVFLAVGEQPPRLSARNCLAGSISRIDKGAVNTEVTVSLTGGRTLTSSISNQGVEELGLVDGMPVWACIKASDVMLAKPALLGSQP